MPHSDSLTKKSAFVTSGRFVNAGMRFLVNLTVARIFAERVALNGEYQQVWLLFNTFFPIFLFGIPQSIYYFYPRSDYDQRGAFVRQSLLLLQILGGVFFVFLFCMAPYAGKLYGTPQLIPHFRWFAVYGFAMVAAGFFDTLFIVMNRHRWQAAVMASEAVLFFCATVVPIYLGAALITVFKCVTALALVKWAFVLGVLASEKREFRLTWTLPQWEKIKTQLAYAAPLGLTAAVGYLSIYLDKNIISGYFGSATYAIYVYGAMEVPFVAMVLSAINNVLVPEISRMHHEGQVQKISRVWQRAISKTSLLLLPMWIFLMIWAVELYVSIYGAPYRASSLIFRIYLLKLPLRITAYNMVLSVIGYPNLVFRIALIEMGINTALSLTFVRWWGMPGPAIATVIATYVQVIVLTRVIRTKLSLRVRDIFPWRHLMKVLSLSLFAGAVSLIAYVAPVAYWAQLILGGALFGVTCLVLFWRSGDIALLFNLPTFSLGRSFRGKNREP
ncbi:MAG: oligosaccharide flippase family protein [Candidatus Latescibacteria bacterium]|nr:oligosaccharide flippase family protein [Candidatus Latescibacterota bacterium]